MHSVDYVSLVIFDNQAKVVFPPTRMNSNQKKMKFSSAVHSIHPGGSSRFISDREEMEETFGSELDRMVVLLAQNLEMTLEFMVDVDILDTWGYENRLSGVTVYSSQRTLPHGDYETILAQIRIHPQQLTGEVDLERFTIQYEGLFGNEFISGPHIIRAKIVDIPFPVTGFTNGMVLSLGTMLPFAQNLKTVGELYYANKSQKNLERAMQLTSNTKKELVNTRMHLDNMGFDDEIKILDEYMNILGKEMQLAAAGINNISNDLEIQALTPKRSLENHINNLYSEISLDLKLKARELLLFTGSPNREPMFRA